MISPEIHAQIRRHFYAEHWKIGTIARELGVPPDTVRHAIESERFRHAQPLRPSIVDPYAEFVIWPLRWILTMVVIKSIV